MNYRPWSVQRPDPAKTAALAAETGMPPLVCGVLLSRGYATAADARAALGEGQTLSSPLRLAHMDDAVRRILHAVDEGERIVVFGDYDVDGVTATAMLYLYLDSVGADVYYKLPSRDDDGYGLSQEAVALMAKKGVKLIVTVDNGVSANEAVAAARAAGIDVVVTDHHLPPETLPDACAVVDPQLPGDESPCKCLCGAGVAFKLIAALEGCEADEMLPFYADLAAIGTVADIMPLTGENRLLVQAGLAQLQHTERPGLAALIAEAGLGDKPITAENVAFALSPRLNAAGRMDSATAALELLLCEDIDEAQQRARQLDEQNTARQAAEQEITAQVLRTIEADPTYQQDRILVVAGEAFHPGVIGIVASRIVERFGKPAIIISVDENGEGKGSGRSFEGLSLYHAIAACAPLLLRFGGHALAAGLSVKKENIPALRRALNEYAARECPALQRPALALDMPVTLGGLREADVEALDLLAPFGHGNPAPLFLLENALVDAVYPVSDGKHSRLRLKQGGGTLYAVLFGRGPEALGYGPGDHVDAALSLSVYEGRAGKMLSGRIRELRPAGLADDYLAGVQAFAALENGSDLTAQQRALLTPARADTVVVYRALQSAPGGLPADDLRPLFAKAGARNAGKALVSLQALVQLGLAQLETQGSFAAYTAVKNPVKCDLAAAPVLRRLEE